jgi:hypothetical protein
MRGVKRSYENINKRKIKNVGRGTRPTFTKPGEAAEHQRSGWNRWLLYIRLILENRI